MLLRKSNGALVAQPRGDFMLLRKSVTAFSVLLAISVGLVTLPDSAAAASATYSGPITYAETAQIPMNTTWALAVNSQTNDIFDAGYEINGATNQVFGPGDTGGADPGDVAVDLATNTAYESGQYPGGINMFNGSSGSQELGVLQASNGGEPISVALDNQTQTLYAFDVNPCQISVWNLAGGPLDTSTEIPLPGDTGCGPFGPGALAMNAGADLIYVANQAAGSLDVINGATNAVVAAVPVFGTTVSYNPDTNEIYVGSQYGSTSILDAATLAQVGTLNFGYTNLAVDPSTNLLFATTVFSGSNVLTVIDGANNAVVQSLALNPYSGGYVAVNTTTHAVYVSNNLISTLEVFTPAQQPQSITFTSSLTRSAVDGATYSPTATGGGSNNPITYSIDSSSTSGCTISSGTVSFLSPAGTCIVDANQAGSSSYLAAPQVQQAITVVPAVMSFTPADAAPGSTVSVDGAGFTSTTSVTIGGVSAQFSVISDTQLSFTVPQGALSGPVSVTSNGETAASAASFVVDPTLGQITGLPSGPMAVNNSVSASFGFTAPSNTTGTVVWTWGDGTTSAGSGTASGTHTYTAAGLYTVSATVADSDGGTGTTIYYGSVVVYDPSAGFVTNGGWINSPAGALVSNPSLTGKGTFGFVSKYQTGATVPTGNATFQFQDGSFSLSSTSYQWLVVSGACKAQLKGSATVNGTGSYAFLITAIDGSLCSNPGPDTFRLQVTDNSTGNTVYDNGTDQSLGGGSITIHS